MKDLVFALWLPQVSVSPRHSKDDWYHCWWRRQALVSTIVHTYFKSAPPALPFDTPVTGIGHRPVVPHHHHIKHSLGVAYCFATEKETV